MTRPPRKLVGAVADRRLAKKSPAAAARVAQLLDGLTLAEAANLPDHIKKGWDGCGGNKLTLFTFFNGGLTSAGKFHGYWDSQTVENAFGQQSNPAVAVKLAGTTPTGWQLSGATETRAEQMANKMLPVAREAHRRLTFTKIVFKPGAKYITSGRAEEVKKPGQEFYAVWAGNVVKREIHRGGWRLAAVLEDALK